MINFPEKKYNIIYADPAWTYKVWSGKGKEKKSAENHYDCMDDDDIFNLPVETIAEKDCVLFLWVTYPLLVQGLETINKWGFTYKTCGFSWIKKNKLWGQLRIFFYHLIFKFFTFCFSCHSMRSKDFCHLINFFIISADHSTFNSRHMVGIIERKIGY